MRPSACSPASTSCPRPPSPPTIPTAPSGTTSSNSSPAGSSALAPLLYPQGKVFSLDFHATPFRGDPTALDNHFLPRRGKAGPSVLSFFAQEAESRVLCYANANLTRTDQPGELMYFVEF